MNVPPFVTKLLGKTISILDRGMPDDAIQKRLEGKEEYQRMHMMWGSVFLSIAVSMGTLALFYMASKKIKPPEIRFVQASGFEVPFNAQQLPNYSSTAVESWAGEVVKKVYTFDFKDMETQVGGAKIYFTQDGWDAFVASWNASTLKDSIRGFKVSPNVVPLQNPVIYWEGGEKGKYAWKVYVPILLSFVGDAKAIPQKRLISVTMVQVPTTENPKGLGVTQFIDQPLSGKK